MLLALKVRLRNQTWQTTLQKIMQTIKLAIDEDLLARIDSIAHELLITRTAFIQQAVEDALNQQTTLAKESQHALGYERSPVVPDEFGDWGSIRVWERP